MKSVLNKSAPFIDFESEILKLKKEMNAVILGHYYQDNDIQDIADFIGDSLDLSRKAAKTDADVIVFCGVKFMAEVAKILNPGKLVIIPDINAGCSLEDSCKAGDFKLFREKHKDAIALTYINCSAEVKALSDIIVTSSNALHIINQIPKDKKIIFAPDKHLGKYLINQTGRDMILWEGTCIVHENFSEKELISLKTRHEKAHIIAHPECPENLLKYAHHIGSTSSLLNYVKSYDSDNFIVLTEQGIIHQMQKIAPKAIFHAVPGLGSGACGSCNACPYMKLNTMEKLYYAMLNKAPIIEVSETVRFGAERSIKAMLEMSTSLKN